MKHSPTHTHSMRQGEVILGPPLVNIASELAGDRLVGGGGCRAEVASSVCLGHFLIRLCRLRRLQG